jgi:uncharacterized repeat protein (TIGR01451 family)
MKNSSSLFSVRLLIICLVSTISVIDCKGKNKSSSLSMLLPIALLGGNSSSSTTGNSSTTTSSSETAPANLVFTAGSTGTNVATLTVGVSVSIIPSVTGTISNCTVNPALPAGLSLNPITCAITGIPTVAFSQTTFTVTATNQSGSTTATITLTGSANPPANLSFPSGGTATFTTGVSSSLVPTFTGGITNCTISPALPTGIVINPSTCAISGTPSAISPQTNYTITASNQFGNTTTNLNFGINTLAPQNLSFSFGGSTTINSNTSVHYTLTVTGGVSSCSVNPSLPTGLTLNTTNCSITGTPTVTTAATVYTITATNQYGSGTVTVTIGTTLVAPTAFSFPYTPGATTTYTIGTPVSVSPAITGVVTNCTVSPTLPAGLIINTTTCAITGTPTAVSGVLTYTITASNGSGNTTTTIKVKVDDVPPSNLAYPFGSSTILAVGTAVSISPTITGGVTSCSPSPALPSGLSINATTCTISGTPSAAKVATAYTITASNAYGNTNVIVTITAQLYAPSSISFPFPGGVINYTTGVAVNVAANISGIVTSCSVNPSLPAGLTLNTTTCAITGTPTGTSPATNYTITASNSSGSRNTTVTIGVNPPAPSNLVYPASNGLSFAVGTAKAITPTVTGTVTNCVTNPTLPAGLTINATTCAIGGTATVEQTSTAYVITASNAGGNVTANITITAAQPPLNLSYPTISTMVYANGVAVNFSPTVTGNGITYSVSPALPNGISLNTSTGAITGTYTQDTGSSVTAYVPGGLLQPPGSKGTYTVTATNSGGNTSANITLTFFGKLPYKTGQTQCYDASGNVISCAGTGQDGEYQSGLPAAVYSAPNNHTTYTNDYTTIDTTSGLVWQTCPTGLSGADCSIGTLVSQNTVSGTCENLNNVNNNNGYAGRTDWRRATPNELDRWAILYFSQPSLTNNFPGAQYSANMKFFSTRAPIGDSTTCYRVDMVDNITGAGGNNGGCLWFGYSGNQRCVSGPYLDKSPSFIDNGDSTISDLSTGVIWQKCALGASGANCQTGSASLMTWSDALNACKNVNLNGKVWKVPNINEASSFTNKFSGHLNDNNTFPYDSGWYEDFWSSTTSDDVLKAYAIKTIGQRQKLLKTSAYRVRCISLAQ